MDVHDNPFIGEHLSSPIFNLINGIWVTGPSTYQIDPSTTNDYAARVLQACCRVAGGGMDGWYATIWEFAHVLHHLCEEGEIQIGPEAHLVGESTHSIGYQQASELILAAARADFPTVVNITKTVVVEANRERRDAELALFEFVGRLLCSMLAVAARADAGEAR
jgi:hypothetical protein